MLSDEEKREMLEDAHDPKRREAFAKARQKAQLRAGWPEYFAFLKSITNLFGRKTPPTKISGLHFKL